MATLALRLLNDVIDDSDLLRVYEICYPNGILDTNLIAVTYALMSSVLELTTKRVDQNFLQRIIVQHDIVSSAEELSSEPEFDANVEQLQLIQLSIGETRMLLEEYLAYKETMRNWNLELRAYHEMDDLYDILAVREEELISSRNLCRLLPYVACFTNVIQQGIETLRLLLDACCEHRNSFTRACHLLADFKNRFGSPELQNEGITPSGIFLHLLRHQGVLPVPPIDPQDPLNNPVQWLTLQLQNGHDEMMQNYFWMLLEVMVRYRHQSVINVLLNNIDQPIKGRVTINATTKPIAEETPNFNAILTTLGAPSNFKSEPFLYDHSELVDRLRNPGIGIFEDTRCSEYNNLLMFEWNELEINLVPEDEPTIQTRILNSDFPHTPSEEKLMLLTNNGESFNMLHVARETLRTIIATKCRQVQIITAFQKLQAFHYETRVSVFLPNSPEAVLSVASRLDDRGIITRIAFAMFTKDGLLHPCHQSARSLNVVAEEVLRCQQNVATPYSEILINSSQDLLQLARIMMQFHVTRVVMHPSVLDRQVVEKIIRHPFSTFQEGRQYEPTLRFEYSSLEATTATGIIVQGMYATTNHPIDFLEATAIATGWMATDKLKAITGMMQPVMLNGVQVHLFDVITWPCDGLWIRRKGPLRNAFLVDLLLRNLSASTFGPNSLQKSILQSSAAWILSNNLENYLAMRGRAVEGEMALNLRMRQLRDTPGVQWNQVWAALEVELVLDVSPMGSQVRTVQDPFADYPEQMNDDNIAQTVTASLDTLLNYFTFPPDSNLVNERLSCICANLIEAADNNIYSKLADSFRKSRMTRSGAKTVFLASLSRYYNHFRPRDLWMLAFNDVLNGGGLVDDFEAYQAAWVDATVTSKNNVIVRMLSEAKGFHLQQNDEIPVEGMENVILPQYNETDQITLEMEEDVLQIIRIRKLLVEMPRYGPMKLPPPEEIHFTDAFQRFARRHLFFNQPFKHAFKFCRPSFRHPDLLDSLNIFPLLQKIYGREWTPATFFLECDFIYECDGVIKADRFRALGALTTLIATTTGWYGMCSEMSGCNLRTVSELIGKAPDDYFTSTTPCPVESKICHGTDPLLVENARYLAATNRGNTGHRPERDFERRWQNLNIDKNFVRQLIKERRAPFRLEILEQIRRENLPQELEHFFLHWNPPSRDSWRDLPVALHQVDVDTQRHHTIGYKSWYGLHVPHHYERSYSFRR